MKNLTTTLCLTIAVLLGSTACAADKTQPPTIGTSHSTSHTTELSLKFTSDKVHLRAGPGVRYPVTKRLDGANALSATLISQEENWIKVRFKGQDHWVHGSMVDRNLTPRARRILYKSSTVNLRSGPGEKFPITRVLEDAQYRIGVPVKRSGDWIRLIFDKRSYWAHSSTIISNPNEAWPSEDAHDLADNQLSFIEERKVQAALGDPKEMELVGSFYESQSNLHLESGLYVVVPCHG